ncbi:hypothetical protein [Biformimicrobium ophioploci]|uniref:hypothetical protein n=1 Tax=Biformimicrobium ophioploci TaxID=3036711 RepID=UPI002557C4CA|nr:hypothetical protein [Microbulbifer sp. NKW57]
MARLIQALWLSELKKMKKIAIFIVVLVSGCSNFTVSTNLGPYANTAVKSGSVKEYSQEEIGKYDATPLGYVEAAFCQDKASDPRPSKSGLVKTLKARASDRGGNGIVVEQCQSFGAEACYKYMECRALAYKVPYKRSMP